MATNSMRTVLQHLRHSLHRNDDTRNDAQLLHQFIDHGDEAAFAAIVRRHGPMVLGVCRRLVRDEHDVEDAFQATFLVLVRKAASLAKRELLASWLYGVAYNTARKARAVSMKRRVREKQVIVMPDPPAREPVAGGDELLALLDQELRQLPEKYRLPIILCELEGKSRRQAAQLLGCPEGSLSSRLARAKAMLARRLARHGLAGAGGSLAAALAQARASAGVPPAVISSTIRSAALLTAGKEAVRGISPQVIALMEGVLKVMLLSKIGAGAIFLVVSLAVFGTSLALYQRAAAQTQTTQKAERGRPPSDAREAKKPRAPAEDELRRDAGALQGRWSVESMIIEGAAVPADLLQAVVVEFKGDKMATKPDIGVDATQPGKVRFHLYNNPYPFQFRLRGSNPKQLELTATAPYEEHKPFICAYKLRGDTLVLSAGQGPGEKTPADISPQGLRQDLWVLKRLPTQENADSRKKEASEPVPIQQTCTSEKNARVKEAWQQYKKTEGKEKRGPRFFALAMLLNPHAYNPPPLISEEVALLLLGEPDFVCDLGARQADGRVVDKAIRYIYIVDNSKGQTIPQEWKAAASEKIEVSVTVRAGGVVGTGWNTYSGK